MQKRGETVAGHSNGARAETELPFAKHVAQRTVVLPELKVLFVPIPKGGCTSILWLLSGLAGMQPETFLHSTLPEVSPSLTVHDMSLWPEGLRLVDYEGDERARVLEEDGWLRFAVVRHPGTRLWSAWQSKILLREPRFVARFGEESWFPRLPNDPLEVVEDFRSFVSALPSGNVEDVHWAVQRDLEKQLPLNHVGRIEELDETLAVLSEHLGHEVGTAARRENRVALPLPPFAYDDAARPILLTRYAEDFEHYGYEADAATSDARSEEQWSAEVAPLLPVLRDTIQKHARIGQLHRVASRVQNLERQIERSESRQHGHSSAPVLTNLENHTEFNVVWAWSEGKPTPGFTAVVRAKNEADPLPWVLPSLFRAVDRVVLVDNGSTDGTPEVARHVAEECGAAERLEVYSYPFSVARCGEEHLETRAESVHSLVYFYNWSFSHVRTGYVLKWDADMVLTEAAEGVLRDLAWQLEADEVVVKIPRYPLYVVDDRHGFLDLGMSNTEPWAWPNRPGYSFVKAMEWEQPLWPATLPNVVLPDFSCIELKRLGADEFSHWTDTDFGQSTRTRRKAREWEVFNSLASGGDAPEDVISIEAPDGVHVIEHVRSIVLPEMAGKRGDFGARLIRQLTA
jgi:sulfotransferase famil protein/glycosyl transferase family 2